MPFEEIILPFEVRSPVLGLGGDVKNSVCFAAGHTAFLSRVHGDLKEPGAFRRFENTIRSIPRIFKVKPALIACDLHPEYFSRKYASENYPPSMVIPVQHHHAHICSSMAENGIAGKKVIGVAFDGTGYGDDSTFWGAEFLVCDYASFERRAHLGQIPLIGGEKAILEPWRLLFAWGILPPGFDNNKTKVLKEMVSAGFNSPSASSMGRLFDAVGALVLKKYKVSYEAEAAIALERCVPDAVSFTFHTYLFGVSKRGSRYIIDPERMFKGMLSDLKAGRQAGIISYRFHLTVAAMMEKICLLLRKETGINNIVLSGGVFQNKILSGLGIGLLRNQKFNVLFHNKVSCSDSGLALGQAAIAAHGKNAHIRQRKN